MINLKDLNKGMLLSGRLSEVHVHNLKQYPFLIFDNLESAEINYNLQPLLDRETGSYVEYILKFKGRVKNIQDEAEVLKKMVGVLLSTEVRVDIAYKKNKKLIYVSGTVDKRTESSG